MGQWLRRRDWHCPSLMLWYWRDQGGNEVDLLIEADGRLIPVECKLKERPGAKDLQGIDRLQSFYGAQQVARAFIACPVEAAFDLRPNITVVPGWQTWPLNS